MKLAPGLATALALAALIMASLGSDATPVGAANVLTNGTFDADVTGWSVTGGGVTLSSTSACCVPVTSLSV